MARVAYPTIVKQLTGNELEANTKIDYVHPRARGRTKAASDAP